MIGLALSSEKYEKHLRTEVAKEVELARQVAIDALLRSLTTSAKESLEEPVVLAFANAKEDLWDHIAKVYQTTLQTLSDDLQTRASSIHLIPVQEDNLLIF